MRVVATAGHVDHGKSTLLRALTGMEPDRWEEERRRGLTIDLGFVWSDLTRSDGSTVTITFVDVPGHERFLPNMLAGAGAVPAALFVVAADDGWNVQSQEHLEILDVLGVAGLAVAVTKADLAGGRRTAEVAQEVRERVRGTTLEGAPVITTDAVSGRGIDDLAAALADRATALPEPADHARPRLWIDRSFSVAGVGTVVTGTLAGGRLHVGQQVRLLPAGAATRVRGLECLGVEVDEVDAGARVGVNLAGVHRDQAPRGSAVVAADDHWALTRSADVLVRALPGRSIGPRGAWHVHVGSAHLGTEVRPLLGTITDHDEGLARLDIASEMPLQYGDRLVIREAGRQQTVAGAVVLDPLPPPRPRGTQGRLHHAAALETLAAAQDDCAVSRRLLEHSGGTCRLDLLLARAGLAEPADCASLVVIDDHAVTSELLSSWQATLVEAVARQPPETGLRTDQLPAVTALPGRASHPSHLLPAVLQTLVDDGTLVRHLDTLVTPAQEAGHLAARAARAASLLQSLDEHGLHPPDPDELRRALGMSVPELQVLVESGDVVLAGDVAFSAAVVDRAGARLRAAFGQSAGGFTASQARDLLETTRKYVVPLLEHLARRGITRFDGTHHHFRNV